MFLSDNDLRAAIFESIKNEEKSISSIYRDLNGRGMKIHRLLLTGYLKALSDTGVLKEREIPPSKVYSISQFGEKDLYEVLGEQVYQMGMSTPESTMMATYFLQKLFKRSIFSEELKRCSMENTEALEKIDGEERSEARKVLSKAGYKLPYNDPAFMVPVNSQKKYEKMYVNLLTDICLEKGKVKNLVADTKQTKLM